LLHIVCMYSVTLSGLVYSYDVNVSGSIRVELESRPSPHRRRVDYLGGDASSCIRKNSSGGSARLIVSKAGSVAGRCGESAVFGRSLS
jgi:hypothetical protein